MGAPYQQPREQMGRKQPQSQTGQAAQGGDVYLAVEGDGETPPAREVPAGHDVRR